MKLFYDRRKRMLSSILILIALYFFTPVIFSHDPYNAKKLLTSLLFTAFIIFLLCLWIILLFYKTVSSRYSASLVQYLYKYLWNDVLFVYFFIFFVHVTFIISMIENGYYTSVVMIKSINFDIALFIVNIIFIFIYFSRAIYIFNPKNVFIKLLNELHKNIKEKKDDNIKKMILLLNDFLKRIDYNTYFDYEMNNLVFDSIKKDIINQGYFVGDYKQIIDMLLLLIRYSILNEDIVKTNELMNILRDIVLSMPVAEAKTLFIYIFNNLRNFILKEISVDEINKVSCIFEYFLNVIEFLSSKSGNPSEYEEMIIIYEDLLGNLSDNIIESNSKDGEKILYILRLYLNIYEYPFIDNKIRDILKGDIYLYLIWLMKVSDEELERNLTKTIQSFYNRNSNHIEMVMDLLVLLLLQSIEHRKRRLYKAILKMIFLNKDIYLKAYKLFFKRNNSLINLNLSKRTIVCLNIVASYLLQLIRTEKKMYYDNNVDDKMDIYEDILYKRLIVASKKRLQYVMIKNTKKL